VEKGGDFKKNDEYFRSRWEKIAGMF
jgi:hypothetical protein